MKLRVIFHPSICLVIILVIVGMGVIHTNDTTIDKQLSPDSKVSYVALADDLHYNFAWSIGPLGGQAVSWEVNDNDGVYGDFSSTGNDITFYLVNSDNYAKWQSYQAFSSFKTYEDVSSGDFTFKIPYDDTWYFIFDNRDSILSTSNVVFDLYMDRTAPTFTVNLSNGLTYSDVKTINVNANDAKFLVSSVKLYIDSWLEKTDYDNSLTYNWDTKDYANGQHTIRVTVSDDVGNSDYREYIVNVNNYIPTTSNPTSPTSTTSGGGGSPAPLGISPIIPIGLGLVGLAVVIGVVFGVKGKGKESPPSPVILSPAQEPPSDDIAESYSVSKETGTPIQVVCPFCGARTQAGVDKCQICGADL